MDKFVLPMIFVCLVIGNNISLGVSGNEEETSLINFKQFTTMRFNTLIENDKMLKEKCFNKTQSNDAYEIIMKAKDQYKVCVRSIVDVINSETEKMKIRYKYRDSFKIAINEYCKKSPDLNDCILNCMSTIDVCLDEDEKNILTIAYNVTEAWFSYICHDKGTTLFYAGNGPDCMSQKENDIHHCENKTINKYIPRGYQTVSSLVAFKFGEDQCKSMSELQVCVNAELEKCENLSAANYVKSMADLHYRFSCSKFQSARTPKQSAGNELLYGNISIPAIVNILKKNINYS